MIRAAALVALLSGPVPAAAECLLGCDITVTRTDAAAGWTNGTGMSVPTGVVVTHALEGGFQDRFIQLRAVADARGLDALLAKLGVTAADFSTDSGLQTTITVADWWRPDAAGARSASINLPGYAGAALILVPDARNQSVTIIYLVAFAS